MAHLVAICGERSCPPVGEGNRAIALDLPGFGRSDKPLDASYSFRFYDRVLTGFLDARRGREVGPRRPRPRRPDRPLLGLAASRAGQPLALLNTLVFARPSLGGDRVRRRSAHARDPLLAHQPGGDSVRDAPGRQRQEPPHRGGGPRLPGAVSSPTTRARCCARPAPSLHPGGMKEIERWLPSIEVPVRIALRRARPHPARRGEDDAQGRRAGAAGRAEHAARLRALLPGGAAGRDRRGAGALLRARLARRVTRTPAHYFICVC